MLPELSEQGLAFLHQEEGWAGKPYWPGSVSGVTIDPGYDLGYVSLETFCSDWEKHLSKLHCDRLSKVVGQRGQAAKVAILRLLDIGIPKDKAMKVFDDVLEPRYAKMTLEAFPGADKLGDNTWTALFSLVYNRGSKVPEFFTDPRREEMYAIREAVQRRNHMDIADQLVVMARVWEGGRKDDDGLVGRREREAQLVDPTVKERLVELRKNRRTP